MATKPSRRRRGQGESPAGCGVTKVTLRLTEQTAKRLGVEAVMSGESQSAIAERVLAAHLSAWRLPSKVGGLPDPPVEPGGSAESAA